MDLYNLNSVQGLPDAELKILKDLIIVWEQKRGNNQKRVEYYLGHNSLDNLGIAIPKEMEGKLKENIGWATKAVNSLAVRSRFDGFVFDGDNDFGLERVLSDNKSLSQSLCKP